MSLLRLWRSYKSMFAAAVLFGLVSLVFFYFDKDNFLANFYLGFVAFFVGCFAIYLYIKKNIDYKRDVANILLMEIRYAENALRQLNGLKDMGSVNFDELIILHTSQWKELKYLFVDELDNDELSSITDFYNGCLSAEKAVQYLSIRPQILEKGLILQRKFAEIALEVDANTEVENAQKTYRDRKNLFIELFASDEATFNSNGPKNDFIKAVSKIGFVTTTTAGQKLKAIAESK